MDKNTFCPLPWMHLHIDTKGIVKPCCISSTNDDEFYNITSSKLEKTINSYRFKKLRKNILNNKKDNNCKECWIKEESNLTSKRTDMIKKYGYYFKNNDIRKITNNDGSLDINNFKALYLDIRPGNMCNLKCRMCGPEESSAWAKEIKKHFDFHEQKKLLEKTPNINWFSINENKEKILEKINDTIDINFAGGEPLLMDNFNIFIDELIEKTNYKEKNFRFHTNLTNLNIKKVKYMTNFNDVDVNISIDGLGKTNNYIRHPSNWNIIEKNIFALNNMKNDHNNLKLNFVYTLQLLNVFDIDKFIIWKFNNELVNINDVRSKNPFIIINNLHKPYIYNIKCLPYEGKLQVKDNITYLGNYIENWVINNYKQYNIKNTNRFVSIFNNYLCKFIDYMFDDDWSFLLPEFYEETKKMDRIRNQTFEVTFPTLYSYIKDYI